METADPPQVEPSLVVPGALTRLLEQLAELPLDARGAGWDLALAPGLVVDRYELVREIGRGGFGLVWEAKDLKLGRRVAFKAVRAGGDLAARERRLEEEAEVAARLGHPSIVTVFDLGRAEKGPYLVLELLEGRTLAAVLRDGPLPLEAAVRIALDVARALAYAHRHGVVHRDLSPRNVFVCDDGPAKVLDLGLARAFGHRPVAGGTRGHMAPEQLRGAPEDERTDVFALGVMLFEMLAGDLPFRVDDDGEELLGPRPAPVLRIPEGPGLANLVARLLAKDPVERPRDGGEVVSALEALREPGTPTPAAAPGDLRVRVLPRWPRLPLFAAAGVTLCSIIGFAAWRASEGKPEERPLVVVADVENRTGDPQLDGLEGLVITSLEQSRRQRVMPRSRMIELARQGGHAEIGRVDEAIGRDIGVRGGARALLVLQVRRIAEVFLFELRALEPRRNSYLFAIRLETARKDGILGLVDRLCEQARERLAEPPREIAGHTLRLEQAVTSSLEAYARYHEGRRLVEGMRLPEAVKAFDDALVLDSGFALAHYELARMPATGELTESQQMEHAAAALALGQRLPPRERAVLSAAGAERAGRSDEAVDLLRRLTVDYPDEVEVQLDLGALLLALERPTEAVPYLDGALRLAPGNEVAGAYLARALGFLGRTEELSEAARRGHAAAPGASTKLLLAEAALWGGDVDTAVSWARAALDAGEGGEAKLTMLVASLRRGDRTLDVTGLDASQRAAIAAFQGKRRDAIGALEGEPLRRGPWESLIAEERVAIASSLGEPGLIRAEAAVLLDLPAPVVRATAAAAAWAGDGDSGARLAERLPPRSADAALHRAVVAFREGRRNEALVALGALSASHASGSSFLDCYLLGEASLEAGRPETAAEALRRFRRMNVPLAWLWAHARGHLLLARAEEALGHREAALAAADRVAMFWRDADPDYPPGVELRALRTRLRR